MAKRRLNQDVRKKLFRLAEDSSTSPAEVAAEDKAYVRAAGLVRAAVDKGFPVEDMRVLEKYEAGCIDRCIRVADAEGQIAGFQFRNDDDTAPLLPRGAGHRRAHKANAKTIDAIAAYDRAKIAREKAVNSTLEDYRAMIFGSRYAEDVLEIWPASGPILTAFIASGSTAVAALSQEAIARIQKTNLGADALDA